MKFSRLVLAAHFFGAFFFVLGCSEKAQGPISSTESITTSATVQKYEGKIIRQTPADRGKDDGWYLVKGGKRRWITDSTWLEKNGYKSSDVLQIESNEFNSIPEDPVAIQ